ncbi:MAG: ABC transporter ATP-binding protein [Lentisphaerae bacterium]|nr:ABC transporter ATP-binding protein [Lentisphaerota bacterium]
MAVNNISFSLQPGQVLGLVGPNGAGKTTLLRMLSTILQPTAGEIRLVGLDSRRNYIEIRRRIGYLPDFFNLYDDLTIGECLEFFAAAYGVPAAEIPTRVTRAMTLTDLTSKRNDFIRHLSRGMVQRMGVAVLTVHDPDLLLLDEPASGLDPRARIQLRDILRGLSGEGKTIVISSHILNDLAGFCSHIAIMDRGRFVVCGDVQTVHAAAVSQRRIEIGLVSGGQEAARAIKNYFGCDILSAEEQRLVISLPQRGPEELASLNALLVTQGFRVTRFAEESTALEDVFMAVCPPGERT